MSLDVPENMEEVAMKIAQAKVRGHELTKEEVITTAVRDILQGYLDEVLEGTMMMSKCWMMGRLR